MTCVIIGAGGHGRVIASIAEALNLPIAGFIDTLEGPIGKWPVIGEDKDLNNLYKNGDISHFLIGIGSIKGGKSIRSKLFDHCTAIGLKPATLIHPAAILASDVHIEKGSVIMAGAILNTGVKIGRNSIINTGAIIDHDCQIGNHTHIAPGCVFSGHVSVGDHTLIGVGTIARQNVKVGNCVTVGAGSLLLSEYSDGLCVFGQPAKPS